MPVESYCIDQVGETIWQQLDPVRIVQTREEAAQTPLSEVLQERVVFDFTVRDAQNLLEHPDFPGLKHPQLDLLKGTDPWKKPWRGKFSLFFGLYWGEGLYSSQIADLLGIGLRTHSRWRHHLGIKAKQLNHYRNTPGFETKRLARTRETYSDPERIKIAAAKIHTPESDRLRVESLREYNRQLAKSPATRKARVEAIRLGRLRARTARMESSKNCSSSD